MVHAKRIRSRFRHNEDENIFTLISEDHLPERRKHKGDVKFEVVHHRIVFRNSEKLHHHEGKHSGKQGILGGQARHKRIGRHQREERKRNAPKRGRRASSAQIATNGAVCRRHAKHLKNTVKRKSRNTTAEPFAANGFRKEPDEIRMDHRVRRVNGSVCILVQLICRIVTVCTGVGSDPHRDPCKENDRPCDKKGAARVERARRFSRDDALQSREAIQKEHDRRRKEGHSRKHLQKSAETVNIGVIHRENTVPHIKKQGKQQTHRRRDHREARICRPQCGAEKEICADKDQNGKYTVAVCKQCGIYGEKERQSEGGNKRQTQTQDSAHGTASACLGNRNVRFVHQCISLSYAFSEFCRRSSGRRQKRDILCLSQADYIMKSVLCQGNSHICRGAAQLIHDLFVRA